VVFFRQQDSITIGLQKELVQRLGELSGKPATSTLHIHPMNNSDRENGSPDKETSLVSSRLQKGVYQNRFLNYGKNQTQKHQWHSDITWEPVPSDYAILRLTELPKTGGGELGILFMGAQNRTDMRAKKKQ
jgi:alpha-ketoglutarate-dependent taurine dioxygenase